MELEFKTKDQVFFSIFPLKWWGEGSGAYSKIHFFLPITHL